MAYRFSWHCPFNHLLAIIEYFIGNLSGWAEIRRLRVWLRLVPPDQVGRRPATVDRDLGGAQEVHRGQRGQRRWIKISCSTSLSKFWASKLANFSLELLNWYLTCFVKSTLVSRRLTLLHFHLLNVEITFSRDFLFWKSQTQHFKNSSLRSWAKLG